MSDNKPFKKFDFDIIFDVNISQTSTMFPELQPYFILNLDEFFSNSKLKRIYMDPSDNELKPSLDPHVANYIIKTGIDMSDADIEKSIYTDYYMHRKIINNPNLAINSSIKELEEEQLKRLPKDSRLIIECFAVHRNEVQFPVHVMVGATSINLYKLYENKKEGLMKVDLMAHESLKVGEITLKLKNYDLNNGYQWEDTRNKNIDSWKKENEKVAMKHAERCYNWFSKFEFPIPVSRRINCYFNFDIFGRSVPGSFVTSKPPNFNSLFFENLYFNAMKRIMIRKGIIEPDMKINEESINKKFREFNRKMKLATLSEMMFMIPTSLNYIGDHVFTNNGRKIDVEDFNRGIIIGKGGDCEDLAWLIYKCHEGFINCKISKNSILHELQCFAKCVVPLITLDRVTSKSVEDTDNRPGEGISAHMNVMAMSAYRFFDSVRLTKNHKEHEFSKLNKAIKTEIGELEKVAQYIRENYDKDFDYKKMEGMVWEGTGVFSPLDEKDPNKKESIYFQKNNPVSIHLSTMIYHPKDDPHQFFTHCMIGMTDLFITKYDVPVAQLFFTTSKKNDDGLLFKGTANYGVGYRDFVEQNPNIKLICSPFMNRTELDILYSTAKVKPKMPDFLINNNYSKKVKNMDLMNINSADLFSQNVETYEYQSKKKTFIPVKYDVKNKEWKFEDGSDLFESNMTNDKIDKITTDVDPTIRFKSRMHYDTMELSMLKEVKKRCELMKKKIKEIKDGQDSNTTDNELVYEMYTTQPRHLLYDKFTDDIIKGIAEKKRIRNFDYAIEQLSDNITNVVFYIGILKFK